MSPRAAKLLKYGFLALALLFFGLFLRDIDYDQLRGLTVSWPLLALATLVGLGFRYWGVMIWRTILRSLGAGELPPFRDMAAVYAKAWMGRYIPGTVTWIAGKVYMASNLGISKSRLTVSSLLEGGMQIAAVAALSSLLLVVDPRLDVLATPLKVALLLLGVEILIVLYPPLFNRLIGTAYRLLKKQTPGEELTINWQAVTRSFLLYAIGAFISGSSYFFLTRALQPSTSFDTYFYLVGAFNLAGAAGMAAIFVPSGLGVRDGLQLILLSAIFPKEVALVITIASRLWSAVVDLLFYLIANALGRQSGKSIT